MIATVQEGIEVYKDNLTWYMRNERYLDEYCSRYNCSLIQENALRNFHGLPNRAKELRDMARVFKLNKEDIHKIYEEIKATEVF